MEKDNVFLIMWDENGLESIVQVDMDKMECERNLEFLHTLSSDSNAPEFTGDHYTRSIARTIEYMNMRAQANGQRFYEIYSLKTSPDITESSLISLFADSPQMIVDLIREKGSRIYGKGMRKSKVRIF